MTEPEELIDKAARVLAETFTTPEGERNPAWDIDKPDGPDNLYYLPRPMAERVEMGAWIVFNDTDGQRSMRPATQVEIAQVLAAAGLLADPEQKAEHQKVLKQLRERTAERDRAERERNGARRERDQLLWLHAEGQHQLDEMANFATEDLRHALWLHAEVVHKYAELLGQRDQWWETVAKQRGEVESQRDRLSLMLRAMARRTRRFRLLMNVNYREVCDAKDVIDGLQARIDKALALAEQHVTFGPVPSPAANVCRQLRAVLQGDPPADDDRLPLADRARMWLEGQPAEPEVSDR